MDLWTLGGLRDKTMKRNQAIQDKASREAKKLMKVIAPLREAGETLSGIASALNDNGVPTSCGGTWTAKLVSRVLLRV